MSISSVISLLTPPPFRLQVNVNTKTWKLPKMQLKGPRHAKPRNMYDHFLLLTFHYHIKHHQSPR